MKFFIDLSKKQLIKSAASNVALERLVLKRRDSLAVEVVFVSRNAPATMPAGTTVSVALKRSFADSNFLASASGTPPVLNLNTVPLEALFSAANPSAVTALLEVRWQIPGETTRTATLTAEIQNSIILGTEGSPEAIPDLKATQAEAQSGTDNQKWMTPLRTAQAIAVLAPPPTWDAVLNKPATFPPSSHGHAIGEITGLQTSLDSKATATALTAEATLRAAADTALGQRIDSALANLDPAAIDSIAEAVTTISTERTERIAGDTALDTKITAETTARTTALAAETTARQTALNAKQNLRTTVSFTLQEGDNYLPVSRNTLFLLSGNFTTARINLPTYLPDGSAAWVGDRIRIVWVGAKANANSRINVVAFAGDGEYPSLAQLHDQGQAAEFVLDPIPRNASGQLTWRADVDPIRWVQPPATPSAFVAANGAVYSPSDVAFDGSHFYIYGKKPDGTPVWLRTPMTATW